jgi:hypothetical protein
MTDTIPPDQLVGFWIRAVDGLVNALAEAIQLDINPDLKTLEIQFHREANIGIPACASLASALKDNRALCEFSMTKANFVAESYDAFSAMLLVNQGLFCFLNYQFSGGEPCEFIQPDGN